MLIVACQRCGEMKVLAGEPDSSGMTRAVWTCSHCGTGQVLELAIKKDVRRGELHKIIRGFALNKTKSQIIDENSSLIDSDHDNFPDD